MTTGREIFNGLIEYPLSVAPGVKDYVFYCGNLGGYGAGAKAFFDKHWPAHVAKTAATLQDVMLALQIEVTSGGVTQIRELVLVAHANINQLFLPVVPAGADVDPAYNCVSAWSLAKLQGEIATRFPSFDQARKAVVPHLLDDSWVTIRACNIGNSAEALYALYAFFGGRANVYAPTKFMVFGDCIIKPGNRIDSKFGVYDYLVKQHFLSSNEHTPKRQAAIVTDLMDPESFSAPFQLATAQLTGGNLDQATAYQQLVAGLDKYGISAELKTAFATAGHALSASPQVVSANDALIVPSTAPSGPQSVWYVRDTSTPDGGQTFDLVYQIRDETDDGGTSTLDARAQLAVDSAYPSIPFQLFFNQFDDDAYWALVGRLAGYADQGPYADQKYKDAYDAIQTLLDAGKWTDGTNDIAKSVNTGLDNAGFDPLPDPPPPIQQTTDADAWLVPTTPPLKIVVELEAAPDGSPLHTIVVRVDLAAAALEDQHKGVIQVRGRVPHSPGTEIAAYLDRYTADELATFMDYLRSAYRPAYAYYLDHALQAIERKRDFSTWMTAQPDYTDPLPAHLILSPSENYDLPKVAYGFDFNDNWREVKQHSKYTATVRSDLFSEGSLIDKLHLTGTYTCGMLPPDSIYFSRNELQALQSKGFEQYFAPGQKNVFEPPPAQVDTGCADFSAALAKWKELGDANATPDVQKQELEQLLGEDRKSAWERIHKTLETVHIGTEIWDMFLEPHIEYRVVGLHLAEHWVTKHVETKVVKEWLKESLKTTAETLEVLAWIEVPFELWMDFAEGQEKTAQYWDLIGQLTAIRWWLRKLSALTSTAPFPSTLNIDIGGEDQAVANWIAEQRAEVDDGLHGAVWTLPPFDDLKDGYARAAVAFGRIGPQIVEQADKYISEKMAEIGLSPCSIQAMTDFGLYDPDALRRSVIRQFADAVRNSLPQVL
jgi:hypothetical protein